MGEKINGSIYFEKALDQGALGCIIQAIQITEEQKEKYKNKIIIQVENTLQTLQDLARYKRSLYDIPIIAITGSVGKTSTKDMVASVISQKYSTLKTMGNYNNHIGAPLTILNLRNHEALVIEMGMNHLGEISTLTDIGKPTVAIITNIGTAHIGILGSRENILKAKLEILEGLSKEGAVIINNDNDLLHKWYKENKENYNIITYGIEEKSDYMAENIKAREEGSTYHLKDTKLTVEVPVGGNHFVSNSLCAIAVGKLFCIPEQKILEGIQKIELTKRRMDIFKIKEDITIINDSYNANLDSMKAAVEYLGSIPNKRKIAVLGDMLELGEYSQLHHEKIGEVVAEQKIDILIVVGKQVNYIAKQAKEKGLNPNNIFICKENKEAIQQLKKCMKQRDCILLKASNGMHFDEIIKGIS